jgi:hypothetical protein
MIKGRKSISTGIERVYKKRQDGLWQEIINHYVHMSDKDGLRITKLDKSIVGRVFKEATANERSFHGETEWQHPDTGQTIRLVALSNFQQGF